MQGSQYARDRVHVDIVIVVQASVDCPLFSNKPPFALANISLLPHARSISCICQLHETTSHSPTHMTVCPNHPLLTTLKPLNHPHQPIRLPRPTTSQTRLQKTQPIRPYANQVTPFPDCTNPDGNPHKFPI